MTPRTDTDLTIPFDAEEVGVVVRAAALRRVSVSECVRHVTIVQARNEAEAADPMIVLAPNEQLAFWTALNETVCLMPAQKMLGKLMLGEG